MLHDPGWLAVLVILATSITSFLTFGLRFRTGLDYYSVGWFVIGCAALLSFRASQEREVLYFSMAVGVAVGGNVFLFLGLGSPSSLSKSLRSAVVGFLIFFALTQIAARYVTPRAVGITALVIFATIEIGLGIYIFIVARGTSSRFRRYIALMFLFCGATLTFEALTRVMGLSVEYAPAYFPKHEGHLPSDTTLAMLAMVCLMSIIARASEVFHQLYLDQFSLLEHEAKVRSSLIQQQAIGHLDQSRSISMLSATLAHELNQPLTAIVANAALVRRYHQRQPDNIDLLKTLGQDLQRDITRISGLLDQYLGDHLSLLQNVSSRSKGCDIGKVVKSVLDWFAPQLEKAEIEVQVDFDASLQQVDLSEVYLTQVLVNLTRNAIQAFSGFSGQERLIRLKGRDAGGEIILSFSDTGPGVYLSDLQEVDQAFSRVKSSGLGLGLSISRWIIERNKGRFSIWSNLGEGFHIQLALPKSEVP